MKRCRIQLSGVSLAPLMLVLLSGASLLSPKFANAQCPGGNPVQSVRYSYPMHMYGTSYYVFSLPQFNPSPGGYTLLAAVLSAKVTTSNTITFTNTTGSMQGFAPQINRSDNIRLNGTIITGGSAQYNDYDYTVLDAPPATTSAVTYGPDVIYNNVPLFNDSIINSTTLTTKYQGAGNLSLSYYTTFFINNVQTGVTSTPAFDDHVDFGITYYYCNPVSLASNILNFTAQLQNEQTADLKWQTTNEQPGRRYEVEVSVNGQDFVAAGYLPSDASLLDANYSYNYSIPPTATGKVYFRIKQIEPSGAAAWSDVRMINLNGNGNQEFSIYPNPPSDFINLTLPGSTRDWQVEIVAADGSIVQRNYYRSTNFVQLNFSRKLAAGAYFVRAINPQTGKHYSGSFLMR